MYSSTRKALLVSALGATVLLGCGGGSDNSSDGATAPAPTPTVTTVAAGAVVKYVADVQAAGSETTEPNDLKLVELTGDDAAEPGTI